MRQKGFTLVEMLIVITIVGMLSILALAGYTEYRKVALLSLTADDLTSTVYQMRDKTIHGDFGSTRVAEILKAVEEKAAGEEGMVDPDDGEARCYGLYFEKKDDEFVPYSFSQKFNGKKVLDNGEWVYEGCIGDRDETPLAFDDMVKFLELRRADGTKVDSAGFALTFIPPEGKILGDNNYLEVTIQYGDNPDDKYQKEIILNYE